MEEKEYKELLFTAFYGQSVDIIDLDIRDAVLDEVSQKFQEQIYAEYKIKYPDTGAMDMYFIAQVARKQDAIKDLDYEKLYLITTRMGEIKKEYLQKLINQSI
jgi:hypothetical protein